MQSLRWHLFTDPAALEQAAAEAILRAGREAAARAGVFHLVLAGGTTPRRVYERLRRAEADWARWRVYFGDERCLPPDHPERNSRMAHAAWLEGVPVPSAQVHVIPAEDGPVPAAAAYTRTLAGVGEFDLVVLGLGEDGHTASLFPGRTWGDAAALPVENAPKPPPQRVSLSPARLSAARQVLFLVSGAGKAEAVAAWRAGREIPACRITPASGVDVFLDRAASGP
ncbi:MAG: 6-phosphogluconolactonase [Betaproteobacteria bacterium]|nr:6-phosphogluconolactonase [Betaproteobacteria bacterium]